MRSFCARGEKLKTDIASAVAERILALCAERGITLNKLCTISAVPQSTANEAVNGVTKNMGIVTIKKLCDGLDITIADFFNTEEFRNLEQEIK